MELKEHITDEKTGTVYTLCGDNYLPRRMSFTISVASAKQNYLQRCQNALLTGYQLKGTLGEYLRGADETCEETFSRLVKQYAEREGGTERLKAGNQMEWVTPMNNIRR